ncbi:site-specific integrase [Sphingomonas sp. PL-96]|uniref:integrase n=1 Tax=Sphingomonas sp. PL-96 TaxID=2887201 RepID=UPI001E4DD38E|nr:site-specific integrase [Sphingomonas sp. PL-96]MCC2977814.1 site-specific integrase [Sphingomonas sp. PL-96]
MSQETMVATIRKRAAGWSVQVRRKGYEPEYRTFTSRDAAERWARERESLIDQGQQPVSHRALRRQTMGDLIRRYLAEITPSKLSAETERFRLTKILRAGICDLALADLSSAPFAAYRDKRAKEARPGTVARELSLLHNVIEIARLEWGVGLAGNPVAQVRRLPVKNARNRRLQHGELERLVEAVAKSRNELIRPAVMLAIETGLRRGELLNLTWAEIDLERRVAHIPRTKTGYARTVPLTDSAVALLRSLRRSDAKVLPMSAMSLKLAWNRLRVRAGMPDLHFHDLRHEAISRFAELGLSTVELAAISGHRDLRMLARYTHIQPSTLARKLAGRSWEQEVGQP